MTPDELVMLLQLTSDTEQAVHGRLRTDLPAVQTCAERAYEGDAPDYPICALDPLERLCALIVLLAEKYDAYRAAGAPDEMVIDTFRDVSLRSRLYGEKHGAPGISSDDALWFHHLAHVAMFKIGSLQFQPFEMVYLDEETVGEPYMAYEQGCKETLPAGAPVLNCHIQAGADLQPAAVEESLRRAREFFSAHSTADYQAFLCYSWLIYPPMVGRLPKTSNIYNFAKRFKVIGRCDDAEQAKEDLRITGRTGTSLQRMAYEHPELLGMACGVITL